MRIPFFTFIFLFIYNQGNSQSFSIDKIPETLRKDADVVIRDYHSIIEIISKSEAVRKEKVLITIYNKRGDSYSNFMEYYDSFRDISFTKGFIYDKNDKLIRKIKRKYLEDFSATSNSSLYDDNRVLYYKPNVPDYPYTVEYNFKTKYNGLLSIPPVAPVPGHHVSVMNYHYTLSFPDNFRVNTYPVNIDTTRTSIHRLPDKILYRFNNIPASEPEPFSPPFSEIAPIVWITPEKFELDGYAGKMDTWNDFGHWVNTLLKNRDILPEEKETQIKNLISTTSDTAEMVKILYSHLQENTRYVSIQLGIGGLQPFEARRVAKVGYGDCKALSNYMRAMLKVAGIPSNYVLVRAGREAPGIIPSLPGQQFNHVIVNVPLSKDTLWLECTSQINPAGYLGSFTGNRYVLQISEKGGNLIKSKEYKPEDNSESRKTTLMVDAHGNAGIISQAIYKGTAMSSLIPLILESPEEQKNWLYKNLEITNFKIESSNFDMVEEPYLFFKVDFKVTVNRYASVTNSRLFVPLNPLNKLNNIPEKNKKRQTNILFRFGFEDYDTVMICFDKRNTIEYLPKPVMLENEFGKYITSIESSDTAIIYTRHLRVNAGRYPPEKYTEFHEFLSKIVNEDMNQMVLLK